ncbi:peptidoglycan-binding protein [Brevibacterium album]|uniref:peptidoglycan-binding protein n=1 Tax=Brevibacterium album TaxID=417948 RepID=UPI0004292EF2|nr:peptidoglycan-binding protein [Brevibacterium album]
MTSHIATYRLGDEDPVLPAVKAQLGRLGYAVGDADSPVFDHRFEYALRSFQQDRGLYADGVLGEQTWEQVELARHRLGDRVLRFDPVRPFAGDDVAELQRRLGRLGLYLWRVDWVFAETTEAAVRELQKNLGLEVDGVAGPRTLRGLDAVTRGQTNGDLFALRETARLHSTGPSLSGRTFIIDAAPQLPMPDEPALQSAHRDSMLAYSADIARRIAGRLAAVGASPFVLDAQSREAEHLIDAQGSALITISQDLHPNPAASGVATFHFGSVSGEQSPIGARLSQLISREIASRTEFLDCGTHPRTWRSLQRYRTPTAHVVAGYITNAEDRARLHSAVVRDALAESVSVALQRLYLTEVNDPETGTVDLTALRDLIDRGGRPR